MAHYVEVVRDNSGKARRNINVTIYTAGTTTKVSLFSDAGMSTSTANPALTNSNGEVNVYLAAGVFDVQFDGADINTKNLSNVSMGVASGTSGIIVETPAGAQNGTNKAFTVTYVPSSGTLKVFYNGNLQELATLVTDSFPAAYTLSGKTITLTNAMVAPNSSNGDWLRCEYVT